MSHALSLRLSFFCVKASRWVDSQVQQIQILVEQSLQLEQSPWDTHSHSHQNQRAALKNSMTASSKPPLPTLCWHFESVLQKALKQILNSQHLSNEREGRNFPLLCAVRGRCQFNCQLAVKSNKACASASPERQHGRDTTK